MTFRVSSGFFVVPNERRNYLNKERKVVEYRRKPDGTYEPIEIESSMPCPCESSGSKNLRELAAYGNTVCRINDGGCWAELRCVPAGTYSVGGEQITLMETCIVVMKKEAFLFDSLRYACELKMWRQEIDDSQ